MKILFITNLYPTYNNPDYGIFTKEQIDNVLKNNDIRGEIIFINAKEKGIKEYIRAYRLIKNNYKKYDFIHCFHGLTLIIAYLATKRINILISFLNAIENESLLNFKLINRIYISVYKFISRKKRIYKIFKDSIPKDSKIANQSYYLPNGVDTSLFNIMPKKDACNLLNLDRDNNYILFVSSKDIKRSQKRYDIYCLVIKYLKEKHSECNFKELVLTNQPRSICNLYYNASSVLLVTSDFEGSPNSVKEAMACNLPIVSTDVGNVSDMLSGLSNCYVSKTNNYAELGDLVYKSHNAKRINLREQLELKRLTASHKTNELIKIYKVIYEFKK